MLQHGAAAPRAGAFLGGLGGCPPEKLIGTIKLLHLLVIAALQSSLLPVNQIGHVSYLITALSTMIIIQLKKTAI